MFKCISGARRTRPDFTYNLTKKRRFFAKLQVKSGRVLRQLWKKNTCFFLFIEVSQRGALLVIAAPSLLSSEVTRWVGAALGASALRCWTGGSLAVTPAAIKQAIVCSEEIILFALTMMIGDLVVLGKLSAEYKVQPEL